MDDDQFRRAVLKALQDIVDAVENLNTSGIESTLDSMQVDVRELNDRVGYLCDVLGPDDDD